MNTALTKTALAAALIALAATVATPVLAASEHDSHGAMAADMTMPGHAPAEANLVDGTVKKVDKAAGKVTLAHGPLTHLGMTTPMTMVFRVKDASWLDQLKDGSKIRFLAESINGVFTVVRFEPAN